MDNRVAAGSDGWVSMMDNPLRFPDDRTGYSISQQLVGR